jgi:hypothetical protein
MIKKQIVILGFYAVKEKIVNELIHKVLSTFKGIWPAAKI